MDFSREKSIKISEKEASGCECKLKIKHCINSGMVSVPPETIKSIQPVFSKDTV